MKISIFSETKHGRRLVNPTDDINIITATKKPLTEINNKY